ncbi:protein kinase domain protein, partial [Metarhizium majus ARSEF 297]
MINKPIDEELLPGDRLRSFHPTRPGEVLDGRFKTIAKLGYGAGSTVWLAENIGFKHSAHTSVPRYVAVKIATLDIDAAWETRISRLIANAEPSHEGLNFIRTHLDKFQLPGEGGTHSCLVYTPMRETLFQLQHRLRGQRFAPPLFKFFMYCLLEAVDYLHTECHLIHTDIKDDNIMVTIENDAVLTNFVKHQKKNSQPKHIRAEDGRETYLSQGDFGPLQGSRLLPKLADFNLAFPGLAGGNGHLAAIQSHRFRAPEVILGCPWSYSVDIWNLGLLMWNLMEDVSLFDRPAGEDGVYDAHVHLAQMVSLLGEPDEELIKRERFFRNYRLEKPVINSRGKEYKNMNEFWGGPFFNDENNILRTDLVDGRKLSDTITELVGDEKEIRGHVRIPWAERELNEYVDYLEEEHPRLANQLEKTPFVKFHGSPHETNKTKDPWHAAAAFRKKEDFKGSGVSLHMYPDGTVVPSKSEFPVYQATAATAAEVGQENAHWLDPEFIAAWQRTDDDAGPAGDKKGKSKAESSKGSSSKGHKSSTKHRSQGSSSKGKAVERSPYSLDPETGIWYRYTENGAVVYLDANSQREYYYDENGQAAWLD